MSATIRAAFSIFAAAAAVTDLAAPAWAQTDFGLLKSYALTKTDLTVNEPVVLTFSVETCPERIPGRVTCSHPRAT